MAIINIGLFGGAFDPVHYGHIQIANECLEKFNLKKVIIMPTGKSVFNKNLTASKHRLEMLKKAFPSKKFEINDFEIESAEKNKLSYSIDTLKYLKSKNNNRLFLILGEDAFNEFEYWHNYEEIMKYCHLIIINRNKNGAYENKMSNKLKIFIDQYIVKNTEQLESKLNGYIFFLNLIPINISSQEIRKEIGEGKNIKELTTSKVINYIKNHKLYLREGQEK